MSNLNLSEEERILREKVNYFISKTRNNDYDNALKYLIQAEGDEKLAVQIYMNIFQNQNFPRNSNNNSNGSNQNNRNGRQQQSSQRNNNLSEFFISENLKNSLPYKSKDSEVYSNFINYLNNKFSFVANSFDNFLKAIKEHAGIIILLDDKVTNDFKNHINNIINDPLCSDIVKNSVLFPIMKDSDIGNEFSQQYSCSNFPSYIFCKYKSHEDIYTTGNMGGNFDKVFLIDCLLKAVPDTNPDLRASLKNSIRINLNSSINNLQINNSNNNRYNNNELNYNDYYLGNSMELNALIEKLCREDLNNIRNSQNNGNNNLNNLNNSIGINDSMFGLSDGERNLNLSARMKELEREKEEKEKREEEEKKKKKEKEEEEDEAELSKQILSEEPEENNPNSCHIIFRYPTGDKNIERRFLKNEKIEILYFFVKSKGREIFFEKESNDFELIYGIPPKNLENSKNKTLEEEGLYPNAIVQIKEN